MRGGDAGEEGVGGGDVVVVAGEDLGGVVAFEADEVGDVVAVVVEDVVDGLALLEEELGAVEVDGEGRGVAPPGDVGVEVGAGEVLLSGDAELGWRGGELVPDEAVHAFGEGLVEGGFEVEAEGLVPLVADGGHAFGGGERLAVDVGGGGGFLDEEAVLVGAAVLFGHGPVFGLDDGGGAEGFEGVEGRAVGTAGLALDAEAEGFAEGGEVVVVSVDEIGYGAAEIVEEAGAEVAAADYAAGDDGEIGDGIVAAAFDELFAEGGGPVGAAELPRVGGEVFEGGAEVGFGGGEEREDAGVPVEVEGGGVEVVDGEALPCVGGGGDAGVGAGVADAEDLPGLGGVGGRGPVCGAVGVGLGGDVLDLVEVGVLIGSCGWGGVEEEVGGVGHREVHLGGGVSEAEICERLARGGGLAGSAGPWSSG